MHFRFLKGKDLRLPVPASPPVTNRLREATSIIDVVHLCGAGAAGDWREREIFYLMSVRTSIDGTIPTDPPHLVWPDGLGRIKAHPL